MNALIVWWSRPATFPGKFAKLLAYIFIQFVLAAVFTFLYICLTKLSCHIFSELRLTDHCDADPSAYFAEKLLEGHDDLFTRLLHFLRGCVQCQLGATTSLLVSTSVVYNVEIKDGIVSLVKTGVLNAFDTCNLNYDITALLKEPAAALDAACNKDIPAEKRAADIVMAYTSLFSWIYSRADPDPYDDIERLDILLKALADKTLSQISRDYYLKEIVLLLEHFCATKKDRIQIIYDAIKAFLESVPLKPIEIKGARPGVGDLTYTTYTTQSAGLVTFILLSLMVLAILLLIWA